MLVRFRIHILFRVGGQSLPVRSGQSSKGWELLFKGIVSWDQKVGGA
jgi:hypothetical protein